MQGSNEWRPLIAVLANPETRRVAARLMLGESMDAATEGMSPSKRRRVADTLMNSGLVSTDGVFAPEVFRAILEAAPVPRRSGVERFLDGTRIRQYPANLTERGELLTWVASRVLAPGEVVTEREFGERLHPYSEDVAVLRRYLVDYALVERRADGSEYALVVTAQEPGR